MELHYLDYHRLWGDEMKSVIKKTNAGSDPLERCLETERDGKRHDLCWSRQCEQHLDQTDLLFNILDESK